MGSIILKQKYAKLQKLEFCGDLLLSLENHSDVLPEWFLYKMLFSSVTKCVR